MLQGRRVRGSGCSGGGSRYTDSYIDEQPSPLLAKDKAKGITQTVAGGCL